MTYIAHTFIAVALDFGDIVRIFLDCVYAKAILWEIRFQTHEEN